MLLFAKAIVSQVQESGTGDRDNDNAQDLFEWKDSEKVQMLFSMRKSWHWPTES